MSMSKKDYIAISRVIWKWRSLAMKGLADANPIPIDAYFAAITCDLANVFQADNPKFDHEQWFNACSVER